MPEKEVNDEGYIYFRDGEDEIAHLPFEGELIIFDADLDHFPQPSPSSQSTRRVACGTIGKVLIKNEKTLI